VAIDTNRTAEAEPLYRQALAIGERASGRTIQMRPFVATTDKNVSLGRYESRNSRL
jgi:hypothetical protein